MQSAACCPRPRDARPAPRRIDDQADGGIARAVANQRAQHAGGVGAAARAGIVLRVGDDDRARRIARHAHGGLHGLVGVMQRAAESGFAASTARSISLAPPACACRRAPTAGRHSGKSAAGKPVANDRLAPLRLDLRRRWYTRAARCRWTASTAESDTAAGAGRYRRAARRAAKPRAARPRVARSRPCRCADRCDSRPARRRGAASRGSCWHAGPGWRRRARPGPTCSRTRAAAARLRRPGARPPSRRADQVDPSSGIAADSPAGSAR